LKLRLLLVLCFVLGAPGVQAADPYEINAILPLTGQGAFLGNSQAETLRALEAQVNKTGGIRGQAVKFNILDDQSTAQTSVVLTNTLLTKQAPVIIGSSLVGLCSAMAPLVEKAGSIMYCLSQPPLQPNGYVFATGRPFGDTAIVLAKFIREHGWTNIALITSTDATGADFDREFAEKTLALPENKSLRLVQRAYFNATDVSVAAQMSRIKGASPQVLVTWASGTPFGTLLHGVQDAGIDVPVTSPSSNMSYGQMTQYAGILPRELYFVAFGGSVVQDLTLPKGPMRNAQTAYFDAMRTAGIKADFLHTLAWDPAMLVVDALRHLGTGASAEALHDYLEHMHGWVGIDGTYDFRANSQRGVGREALYVYRWDQRKSDFALAGRGR
jgi:branched-chain amino acid transport system substrate-binding protein